MTNTTNNIKICYLIVVVSQQMELPYKLSLPFNFQGKKRRKKVKTRPRKGRKMGE